MELAELIDEISLRMRLLKVAQESKSAEQYSERDILLLELIGSNKRMGVSEISAQFKVVSKSVLSTTISNFWKADLVNKEKDADNQRITYVNLTTKGKKLLDKIRKNKAARFTALINALKLDTKQKAMIEQILTNAIKIFDEKTEKGIANNL